jgi:hypothetical protein
LAFVAFITSYIFVLYSGKAVRSDSVIGKECSTETVVKGDVTFLWIATTICWVYLITREFLQFGIAPKRYIFTLGNSLKVIDNLQLFGCVLICGPCPLEGPEQQFQEQLVFISTQKHKIGLKTFCHHEIINK